MGDAAGWADAGGATSNATHAATLSKSHQVPTRPRPPEKWCRADGGRRRDTSRARREAGNLRRRRVTRSAPLCEEWSAACKFSRRMLPARAASRTPSPAVPGTAGLAACPGAGVLVSSPGSGSLGRSGCGNRPYQSRPHPRAQPFGPSTLWPLVRNRAVTNRALPPPPEQAGGAYRPPPSTLRCSAPCPRALEGSATP